MPLTVSDTGGDFKPIDAGIYPAVLYGLIDLGTQYSEMFNNHQHKVMLIWELPGERIEIDGEDKPKVISKEYTLSLGEKANLRNDLVSWRGRDFTPQELIRFDISTIMGACCQLNIIHKVSKKGRTYAVISGIMPLGKNVQKFGHENEQLYFSFEDGGELPEATPDWIKSKVMASQEYNELGQMNEERGDKGDWGGVGQDDSDIPF